MVPELVEAREGGRPQRPANGIAEATLRKRSGDGRPEGGRSGDAGMRKQPGAVWQQSRLEKPKRRSGAENDRHLIKAGTVSEAAPRDAGSAKRKEIDPFAGGPATSALARIHHTEP